MTIKKRLVTSENKKILDLTEELVKLQKFEKICKLQSNLTKINKIENYMKNICDHVYYHEREKVCSFFTYVSTKEYIYLVDTYFHLHDDNIFDELIFVIFICVHKSEVNSNTLNTLKEKNRLKYYGAISSNNHFDLCKKMISGIIKRTTIEFENDYSKDGVEKMSSGVFGSKNPILYTYIQELTKESAIKFTEKFQEERKVVTSMRNLNF